MNKEHQYLVGKKKNSWHYFNFRAEINFTPSCVSSSHSHPNSLELERNKRVEKKGNEGGKGRERKTKKPLRRKRGMRKREREREPPSSSNGDVQIAVVTRWEGVGWDERGWLASQGVTLQRSKAIYLVVLANG